MSSSAVVGSLTNASTGEDRSELAAGLRDIGSSGAFFLDFVGPSKFWICFVFGILF